MFIQDFLKARGNEFEALCQKYGVISCYAFGSSVTEAFKSESSDIDLLVSLNEENPVERGLKLLAFWDAAEVFFGRKVDLITPESIRNSYLKKAIESSKVCIYDQSAQEIPV